MTLRDTENYLREDIISIKIKSKRKVINLQLQTWEICNKIKLTLKIALKNYLDLLEGFNYAGHNMSDILNEEAILKHKVLILSMEWKVEQWSINATTRVRYS